MTTLIKLLLWSLLFLCAFALLTAQQAGWAMTLLCYGLFYAGVTIGTCVYYVVTRND